VHQNPKRVTRKQKQKKRKKRRLILTKRNEKAAYTLLFHFVCLHATFYSRRMGRFRHRRYSYVKRR
jgi:hypothetical protein